MAQPIILVADPNPLTHRRVLEALSDVRLDIVTARDAQEAEKKAREAPIAVLLSATVLPRGNGYDLTRAIRALHPGVKAWLLSGGFEVYNVERARDAGVMGQLAKPISASLLRSTVSSVLDQSAPAEAAEAPPPAEASPQAVEDEAVDVPVEPLDGQGNYAPPTSVERIATFLPRDYVELPLVRVDPDVVGPALERAILEVLPEVVEVVLRRVLRTSSSFRDLVETAVDEAVREKLPALAERLVAERVRELAARGADDLDAL